MSEFGEICKRVCEAEGWELVPAGIQVPLPDGRSQLVELETFSLEGRAMVRLVTTIGSAGALGAIRHSVALRLNGELAHGAFAIRESELVMVETLIIDDADPGEIESSVRYLAETADAQEERLFGGDEH